MLLITGKKWHLLAKVVHKALSYQKFPNFVKIFHSEVQSLIEQLRPLAGSSVAVDLHRPVAKTVLKIVCRKFLLIWLYSLTFDNYFCRDFCGH